MHALRPRTQVCHLCDFLIERQATRFRPNRQARLLANGSRLYTTTKILTAKKGRTTPNADKTANPLQIKLPIRYHAKPASTRTAVSGTALPEQDVREIVTEWEKLLHGSTIPSDAEVTAILKSCQGIAERLINPTGSTNNAGGSEASALLSVDESAPVKAAPRSSKISPAAQSTLDQLSEVAHSLMTYPPVFISPQILEQYVELQALLGKSDTFPEVFRMYSSKPVPEEGSSPIKYTDQNPNKAAAAIPVSAADKALQSAIDAKSLGTAMEIVESSYASKAFQRAKFIRKALLPITGFAAAPVAAYTVASQLAVYQTTMDPATATNVAFAGILTYLGGTTVIGVVALTTANDQMDRITWAEGLPLRERWIREDERAAVDKIAGAWGFRQSWKRGEEEGPEWDAIREWAGRKGMLLDRTDLMEGME